MKPASTIRYVVPLGPGRPRAEFLLPEDFTVLEAKRLAAILATLPLPISEEWRP